MSFEKSDGAKIKITFDESLYGDVSGNAEYFTVTTQEYDYVPNGTLETITKTVDSVEAGDTNKEIVLNMEPLERFESAVGNITVSYDGLGNLAGAGGNVAAFTEIFTPTGLVAKPNQMMNEHIEISDVDINALLTLINFYDTAETEHIEISDVDIIAILTHVDDI